MKAKMNAEAGNGEQIQPPGFRKEGVKISVSLGS